jgi:hypothetical protein
MLPGLLERLDESPKEDQLNLSWGIFPIFQLPGKFF